MLPPAGWSPNLDDDDKLKSYNDSLEERNHGVSFMGGQLFSKSYSSSWRQ